MWTSIPTESRSAAVQAPAATMVFLALITPRFVLTPDAVESCQKYGSPGIPKGSCGSTIMLSTFVKTAEEKQGAAEAINYYNPETIFQNGQFRLTDFGAQHYGHELCYYTKSYLGESLRFTTKIMELDKKAKILSKKNIQLKRMSPQDIPDSNFKGPF